MRHGRLKAPERRALATLLKHVESPITEGIDMLERRGMATFSRIVTDERGGRKLYRLTERGIKAALQLARGTPNAPSR